MNIDLDKLEFHVQHMWNGAVVPDMARVNYHAGNIQYMIQEARKQQAQIPPLGCSPLPGDSADNCGQPPLHDPKDQA